MSAPPPAQEGVRRIPAELPVRIEDVARGSKLASRLQLAVAGTLFLLIIVVALFVPVLAPHDPSAISLGTTLKPPSAQNWLGTDQLGRDVLTRVMWGTRISLLIAGCAVVVAGIFGGVMGLLAGYFGGIVDSVTMRLADIQLALPTVIMALVLVGAVGFSLFNLILVLGLANWARFARVTRSEALTLRQRDFVLLAKLAGASPLRVLARHIAPNVVNTFIVLVTLDVGIIIILEATLSFLGLGVQPPDPSWGQMIADGRGYLETAWWICIMPGLALTVTVLCANLLGDSLRDWLNPNLGGKW